MNAVVPLFTPPPPPPRLMSPQPLYTIYPLSPSLGGGGAKWREYGISKFRETRLVVELHAHSVTFVIALQLTFRESDRKRTQQNLSRSKSHAT